MKSPLNKLGWCKGNLFKIVECLKSQLQKVQTEIDVDPHNQSMRDTKSKLVEEFYEAEVDEEKFLYQQAKIKWLSEGDMNISFFHKILKERCNRRTNHPVDDIEPSENLFQRRISNDVAERMIADIFDAEIKCALFDIGDFKAPGPDGFTLSFFRKS
ncbi:hypothetical protein Tco_0908809 [Tanacetum coccineum]|uniref:RNA-directed DNA polymerase, eukaryota, reverse transcriptase zinc-binding domain protein n=1 Tax=Tanacetum coccineum TaxID=301880 RepID=A0ABQ5CP98_9ASTR